MPPFEQNHGIRLKQARTLILVLSLGAVATLAALAVAPELAKGWRDNLWSILSGLLSLWVIAFLLWRQGRSSAADRLSREHQTIFNNVMVGIAFIKNRHIIYSNRRLEEIFGYDPGELIGQSTALLYPTQAVFEKIGQEAYPRGLEQKGFNTELTLKHKDGSLFHGALTGRAIDPMHPHDGSIWIYADISERHDAQEEAQKLRQAVQQSPVSIIITNRQGLIEYVNPRFTKVTGFPPEEAIGQNPRILRSDETPQDTYEKLWKTILAGKEWRGIMRNKRKDGTLFWVDTSISPIFDEAGQVTHFIAVKEDITERKQAENALRRSEAMFQSVSQSANDAIITADSSGNIVKWNSGAELIFGYTASEVTGQPLTLLVPSRFHERHLSGMARINAGGEPKTMGKSIELFGVHKNGSEFPLELSLAHWQIPEGRFFTGIIRDISARRKIEQELEDQKEHLEELVESRTRQLSQALEAAELADRTKDAFLANISHELRTPLNAVIGMAGLARQLSNDPKQRYYLDKVSSSGKHLGLIINDLLDLSKIAAGHMEFEIITFSLHDLLEQSRSAKAPLAAEKGLTLVETIDPAVPDALRGDPLRLEQILINLIDNAIRFTPTGQIEVRIGLHTREETRVCLNIEVEDSGIGISAADLAHLFKPFSQADASVSRKFGGTGLGLAICRRLAQQMDGDITVDSQEGHGTTFKVRIWLELGALPNLPTAATPSAEGGARRYKDAHILVVDDHPLNREIVEALLNSVGIVATMAENGQQALDILSKNSVNAFDLVLMDIQMPVMDGLSATRALRNQAAFSELPIIAMTAHTMVHERESFAAIGMNDHIGKPFENKDFYHTLSKWLPREKQLPEDVAANMLDHADPESSLSTLQGIDVTAALARFGGNETRYRHWLAEFMATASGISDTIRVDLAIGQSDTARKMAHAFKGRVGMLGMTELHELVSSLETALQDGTPSDALLVKVDQVIRQTSDELAKVLACSAASVNLKLQTNPPGPPPPTSESHLERFFQRRCRRAG